MALEFGFYNSIDHDRKYNNTQMSSIFNGIILDGVFRTCKIKGSTSNNDKFNATSAGGMKISVGRGKAWFNNTWNLNDSVMEFTLDNSDDTLSRYDAVVLEINSDYDYRENAIKIVKGRVSEIPAHPILLKSKTLHQYALAYIYVPAGSTEILPENIDNVVGTEETPYVISIADDIETKTMNALDATNSGFMLDARQGKVLNDEIPSKISKGQVRNDLETTEEGYALDARQGKALSDLLSHQIGHDRLIDNLDKIVAGDPLDARQGNVLRDGINTTDRLADNANVDSRLSPINTSLTASENKLKSRNKTFQFGIDSDNNYGYYKDNTFIPFKVHDGRTTAVDLGKITTKDLSVEYPSLYHTFDATNFRIIIYEITYSGGYSGDELIENEGDTLVLDLVLSPLTLNPNITYNASNGRLNVSDLSKTITTSHYKLLHYDEDPEWTQPYINEQIEQTITIEDYTIMLVY